MTAALRRLSWRIDDKAFSKGNLADVDSANSGDVPAYMHCVYTQEAERDKTIAVSLP